MTSPAYAVRWLVPEDAEQIADLESRVHASEHQAGNRLIREQLRVTESDGRNLSLGLYHGARLIGFALIFVMQDRREMADFFDAPLPRELDASQKTIYVADWVVEPRHRKAARLMSARFGNLVNQREDLRNLPMDAFATAEYARKWSALGSFIGRLGWEFLSQHPFEDMRLGKTLYWLCFRRLPPKQDETASLDPGKAGLRAAPVRSPADWSALRQHWPALLAGTPEPSVVQSWEYLRHWYAHFGAMEEPFVVAVIRDGVPVALAPLQIAARWHRGAHRPTLCFPAATGAAEVSRILGETADTQVAQELAASVLAVDDAWEAIDLAFHSSQRAFAQRLKDLLSRKGCPCSLREVPLEYRLQPGRSPSPQPAPLPAERFEIAEVKNEAQLHRYLSLEQQGADDEAGHGACASSRHISFHRALVGCAEGPRTYAGFLHTGGECAAGMLGFAWRKQFYLVHVTRTERHAAARPQDRALARLAEWCAGPGACGHIDLTALARLPAVDLAAWNPRISSGLRLRARRATLRGWVLHGMERLS